MADRSAGAPGSRASSGGRHVVTTRGYTLVEVPPELEDVDEQTGRPLVARMYAGHRHTPLCGSRDRIVVGVDESGHSRAALRWAAEEARLRHTHLHVVHTYGPEALGRPSLREVLRDLLPGAPGSPTAQQREARQREEAADQQEGWLTTFLAGALPPIPVEIESMPESLAVAGSAPETLVAASHGAALLVVGTHQDGRASVARRTVAKATCPVAVVREGQRLGLHGTVATAGSDDVHDRIVVGVDDSFTARDALWFAADEAVFRTGPRDRGDPRDVELVVVRVSDPCGIVSPGAGPLAGPAQELLESLVAEVFDNPKLVGAPGRVTVVAEVEAGGATAGQTLVERSGTADLLVIGCRGHGALSDARVSSVVTECLQHARCPVVVAADAPEDRDPGIGRARIGLEELWARERGPTLWGPGPLPVSLAPAERPPSAAPPGPGPG